jgi:LytS/YehU family sensor histidine kinase
MIFVYIFGEERPPDRTSIDVYFLVVAMYFIVFLVIAIKMMTSWYRRQQDMQEISRQKLEAELKMLRSQIQPHFLFNSLNSIYALSLKKSDEAPEMIIKLSGILDYLLYECDAELVLLEKEITVIENYIELQSIRFGDKLNLKFQVEGEVGDIKIAPMLLLPLVENSFKHGVDAKRINAWVHISLDVFAERMVFNISNSLSEKGTKDKEHGGIGLTNLKKRLNLLYPERYSFELTEDVDKFEINLEIELNES